MKTTRTIGAAFKLLIPLLAVVVFAKVASDCAYTKVSSKTAPKLTGAWVTGIVPPAIDSTLWDSTSKESPPTQARQSDRSLLTLGTVQLICLSAWPSAQANLPHNCLQHLKSDILSEKEH